MRNSLILVVILASPSAFPQERFPVIDMHMHARVTMPRDADGTPLRRPCEPLPCQGQPAAASEDEQILELTLEAMDRHNIVLGFLSERPERVMQWLETAPDRFIGGVMFRPGINAANLERAYESGVFKGVGELHPLYWGIYIDDPLLDKYFRIAERYDLPVLVHIAGIAGASNERRIRTGHPERLENVLRQHPTIRVYLENAGFPFFDEAISLMYAFPNVYADYSTVTWLFPRPIVYEYLDRLFKAGLGKRIMFGSDQMAWPEVIGEAIGFIESADFLTEDQKRDILYNNAARFLRLPDETIAAHHAASE